jgi:NAD(P)-dependent dehydrogenase (short-subunit alcohol dehydrogenase family)
LHIAEAFADHVARSQQKKIASITSGMGSIGNNSAGTAYVYRTSKAGLNMAMVTAANHFRAQDVIVVVISPGWVKTDMGGANATLTVSDSAAGIRKVIAGLTPKTSGRFFNHSGEELPW